MSQEKIPHVPLRERVQHNCHLSDAHHARDYSLCIYLLKMREFYRWEQGLPFGASLAKGPLGAWLTTRESHWEAIAAGDFLPIELEDGSYSPFDSEAINARLRGERLVYSGGYCGAKPHFFLAELEGTERVEGATIYLAGHELARELTAPPAMSLGNTVFLRRESLQRMIWEKLEEWGWQEPQRAIARAASFYDFRDGLQTGLDVITTNELATLRQHELGELAIGRELGPDWEALLALLPRSRVELQLRAIRDHLVDCRRTLPWLLDEGRDAALHFYFANFTAMHRATFPALESGYQRWLAGDGGRALREAVNLGAEAWWHQAQGALAIYREWGGESDVLLRHLQAVPPVPL